MIRNTIVLGCLSLASASQAASLDLVYTGDNQVLGENTIIAVAGDIVTFDIILNFTGEPTLGGGFDVFFTASQLDFMSYDMSDLGNPLFSRSPDVLDGFLEGAAVGSFDGLEFGLIAQVSFMVTGNAGFFIELAPTPTTGASWISAEDFVTPIDPDYGSVIGVSQVPLPAAVWLLLGSLGTFFGLRR